MLILKKEIPLLEEDIEKVVEDEIENIYLSESTKVLFWIDEQVFAEKSGKEEDVVNKCCESLYFKTPQINNEIVNRSEISTGADKTCKIIIHLSNIRIKRIAVIFIEEQIRRRPFIELFFVVQE